MKLAPLSLLLLWIVVPLAHAAAREGGPPGPSLGPEFKTYVTPYYIIRTDLDTYDTKQAIIRMNKMVEEYRKRTAGFSGAIRQRLPFTLFRHPEDYYDAGGLPGSAGVFTGQALLAVAGEHADARTWHVVQHEGFHQFAAAVIRGQLPTWLNEGIAEYFGESVFTGDGFVSGVVPPWRLKRVREEIKDHKFKTIRQIMLMPHSEWNSDLSATNYDQAWSMVQFLAHGENGKYQEPFVHFMRLIGGGTPWPTAWRQTLGDASGFEQRWRQYWLNLPEDVSVPLYAQATVETLNSYLARAAAHKQRFSSFDALLSAAASGELKTGQTMEEWLPPKLLTDALDWVKHSDAVRWQLLDGRTSPRLVATLPDGTRIIGTFVLDGARVARAGVEIDDTAEAVAQASEMLQAGKREAAKALLQRALRAHPHSPDAERARKLIAQTGR